MKTISILTMCMFFTTFIFAGGGGGADKGDKGYRDKVGISHDNQAACKESYSSGGAVAGAGIGAGIGASNGGPTGAAVGAGVGLAVGEKVGQFAGARVCPVDKP